MISSKKAAICTVEGEKYSMRQQGGTLYIWLPVGCAKVLPSLAAYVLHKLETSKIEEVHYIVSIDEE